MNSKKEGHKVILENSWLRSQKTTNTLCAYLCTQVLSPSMSKTMGACPGSSPLFCFSDIPMDCYSAESEEMPQDTEMFLLMIPNQKLVVWHMHSCMYTHRKKLLAFLFDAWVGGQEVAVIGLG